MAINFPTVGSSTTGSVAAQTTTSGNGIQFPTVQDTTPNIEFTPGGARFTPFSADEFIFRGEDTNTELDRAAMEQQVQNDLQAIGLDEPDPNEFKPLSPDITQLRTTEMLADLNEMYETELMRIDQVIAEKEPNFQGGKAIGPMSFNVSDGIARRRMSGDFADRQAYFKKHYPEGRYFRVPTGGGKFAELYSITEGGEVYNVDPTGFSDVSNELANLSGTVLNFTTAGSVVGSLFSPLLGTATGATLGNLVDQAILDETSMTMDEVVEKLRLGDAATIGLVDGVITKVMPIAGGKLRQLMTGADQGGSILAKKAAGEQALKVQKSAESLNLPLLSVAQLSNNQLVRGSFSQTAGTSSIPGRMLNNQQRRLYEALSAKAANNFESFTATELRMYTDLQQKALAEEVHMLVASKFGGKLPEGMTLEAIERSIRDNAGKLQVSHNELIDEAYKKAFSSADAESVVFDLNPVKEIARTIQLGTQTRTVPKGGRTPSGIPLDTKGKFAQETTKRIEGELSGDLAAITNDILNVIDPTVSKLVVKDKGGKFSYDALSQLKGLRDRASRIVNEGSGDSAKAKQLVDAIDEVLENPVGGGTTFKKYYGEAKDLVKLKVDVQNASNIASMFSRKSDVMPNELAEKFWNGTFTSRDWDYMERMAQSAAGNKPEAKMAAVSLLADVRDGFLTWIYQNPAQAQARIKNIMDADNELFKKMVPAEADRKALAEIAEKSTWLQSDGVQKALQRQFTVGERALTAVNEMSEAEIINFINKNGGVNGETAESMRAAIFKKILDGNSTFDEQGLNIVNSKPLAEEFTKLTNFSDKYSKYKPLFQSATLKDDIVTYGQGQTPYLKNLQDYQLYSAFLAGYTPDVGGPMQAGSVRAQLAKLDLGAYRTVLTNDILAKVFSSPPSVKQLEKLFGGKGLTGFWNRKSANVYSNILGNIGEGLMKDVETPKEEVERTSQPPMMGDVSALETEATTDVASAPVTPPVTAPASPVASANIGLPKIPLASVPPATQPSSTDYASLFPRDELGSAIASRGQGIMSLG